MLKAMLKSFFVSKNKIKRAFIFIFENELQFKVTDKHSKAINHI